MSSSAAAGQSRPRHASDFWPLVVPVAIGAAPYDAETLWRVYSAGDTTPATYRAQYGHRPCERTPSFAARNLGSCRALVLIPWLILPEAVPDSILLRRALMHADSLTELSYHADSAGDADHLLVLMAGDARPSREVRVDYRARYSSYAARFDSGVLGSLPVAFNEVTELEFAEAMVAALRLPAGSLMRDQADTLFLHPEVRYGLVGTELRPLRPGDRAEFDVGVYQCGHLDCVHVAPPLVMAESAQCSLTVYVSAVHRHGVHVEQAEPLTRRSSGVGRVWRQLIPRGEDAEVKCADAGLATALASVTWHGQRTTVVAR